MNEPTGTRRPLKTRETKWAAKCARFLAGTGLRPNQISLLSIVFAIAGGALFVGVHTSAGLKTKVLCLLGAAVCIQLRLLCNLFDGMVAVECGFKSRAGEIYNDFPDRVADVLFFIGAGIAVSQLPYGMELGWTAAILSVFTAYVRILGGSCGVKQDFCGPMAKPHRMATLTVACLAAIVEILLQWPSRILYVALIVIVVGSVITVARRLNRILRALK